MTPTEQESVRVTSSRLMRTETALSASRSGWASLWVTDRLDREIETSLSDQTFPGHYKGKAEALPPSLDCLGQEDFVSACRSQGTGHCPR